MSEPEMQIGIRPDDSDSGVLFCMVCGSDIPANANQVAGGEVLGCCSWECADKLDRRACGLRHTGPCTADRDVGDRA